jgi:hypothetical protein
MRPPSRRGTAGSGRAGLWRYAASSGARIASDCRRLPPQPVGRRDVVGVERADYRGRPLAGRGRGDDPSATASLTIRYRPAGRVRPCARQGVARWGRDNMRVMLSKPSDSFILSKSLSPAATQSSSKAHPGGIWQERTPL